MTTVSKEELLRKGDLVIHCVDVEIFQTESDGLRLKGHGSIKVNKVGTLYLEFISVEADKVPRAFFAERIPKDSLDEKEILHLKAKSINGDMYESQGFSIEVNFNTNNQPTLLYVFLSSLTCRSQTKDYEPFDNQYLYFEFSERFDIPANKSNSETSTLGNESHTWNQTLINVENFNVSMVKHKTYTEVRVEGQFDIAEVKTCLLFYIGFTSASMPQLVLTVERDGKSKTEIISSVRNSQKLQSSTSPIASNVSTTKGDRQQYHYNLFSNILALYRSQRGRFDSIYSQWERVWYAFQSQNSILMLTLSVGIEGLLNDIYIPRIKKKNDNSALKAQIRKINKEIKKLELTKGQKERLCNSVGYWGNVTALNALDHLIEHNVITKEDKDRWKELRNESAHPRVKVDSLSCEIEEREKVLSCLNTFHKLILNTLSYSGPVALLNGNKDHDLIEVIFQNILD
ncbi:hypothetical protein [Neptunicella sp.]|uniref:hypothetical protein n=1 Tax=Neptunicella sp. TaxID=2125986 RepID=UPI003F68F919